MDSYVPELRVPGAEVIVDRINALAVEDPKAALEVIALLNRGVNLERPKVPLNNYAMSLAGALVLGALALSLYAVVNSPPPQGSGYTNAEAARFFDGAATDLERQERVSLLGELSTKLGGRPIEEADVRPLINPSVDSGRNPASGGYGNGEPASSVTSTGGSKIEDNGAWGTVTRPVDPSLYPGNMYQESTGETDGVGPVTQGVSATVSSSTIKMSAKVRDLYSQGKYREALDVHYEDLVRGRVGGTSQYINGREIDVVTDSALIQVKRTRSALEKPKNFLNKATREQIKITIDIANEQGKTAEFWFKYGVSPTVRNYIESKGGVVKTGLGE